MQQQMMNFMRWGKWEVGKSPGRNGWYCKHPSELVWKYGPQSWVQPWGKTQIQYLHTLSAWIFRPHLSLRAQIHYYHHPKNKPKKLQKMQPKQKKVNNEENNIPFNEQSLSGRIRSPKHTTWNFKIRKSPGKKIVRKRARERKEGKKRLLSTYLEDDSFGP